MNRNLGLILVIVGVILIGVTVLFTAPKQNSEQKIVEAELNNEQLHFLIKEMQKYLIPSDNINTDTTFTLDEMIKFAFSYTIYLDAAGEYTSFDEITGIGTASINKIKENINLIFGINKVNLEESSFTISEDKIKVDLNTQGGDAVVYKFKQRNVNNSTGVYITDIDCLEYVSQNDQSSLLAKSEYNEEDVVYTLQIKYREVNGRKILLAYSIYSNY